MSDPRNVAHPGTSRVAPTVCAATTWFTCSTTEVPAPDGPVIVLRLAGEVDLTTVGHLHAALTAVLAQRPSHLIVDLAEVTFCSARGLRVLGEAGDSAAVLRTGYFVAGASARLNWIWSRGWTAAERPTGFPTVADAVLAATAHRRGQPDRAAAGSAAPPAAGRPVPLIA